MSRAAVRCTICTGFIIDMSMPFAKRAVGCALKLPCEVSVFYSNLNKKIYIKKIYGMNDLSVSMLYKDSECNLPAKLRLFWCFWSFPLVNTNQPFLNYDEAVSNRLFTRC